MLKLVLIVYGIIDYIATSHTISSDWSDSDFIMVPIILKGKVTYISIFGNLCGQVLYYDQLDLTGLPSLKAKRYYLKLCALYNILKTSLTLLKIHLFCNLVEMSFSVLLTLPAVCKNKSISIIETVHFVE